MNYIYFIYICIYASARVCICIYESFEGKSNRMNKYGSHIRSDKHTDTYESSGINHEPH